MQLCVRLFACWKCWNESVSEPPKNSIIQLAPIRCVLVALGMHTQIYTKFRWEHHKHTILCIARCQNEIVYALAHTLTLGLNRNHFKLEYETEQRFKTKKKKNSIRKNFPLEIEKIDTKKMKRRGKENNNTAKEKLKTKCKFWFVAYVKKRRSRFVTAFFPLQTLLFFFAWLYFTSCEMPLRLMTSMTRSACNSLPKTNACIQSTKFQL